MILGYDEFLARVKAKIGDSTTDEDISFLEDMTDTYNDLIARNAEDWKTKYQENDAEWRKKYTSRFFDDVKTPATETKEIIIESEDTVDESPKTFDELFYE